jgi:hypothetical protein
MANASQQKLKHKTRLQILLAIVVDFFTSLLTGGTNVGPR